MNAIFRTVLRLPPITKNELISFCTGQLKFVRLRAVSIVAMLLFLVVSVPVLGQTGTIREADKAFEQREYAVARGLYSQSRDVIRSGNEKDREEWKRLTTQIVRCQTALGNMEQATEEYFLLCRLDPLTPLDGIPLPWFVPLDAKQLKPAREKTAEDWLDPMKSTLRGPSATLLAAAILSTSNHPAKNSKGKQHLRNLVNAFDTQPGDDKKTREDKAQRIQREVALLAGILLWPAERIPKLRKTSDLLPLQRILEQLPENQRAGPYFLYGRAARQVGQSEDAVIAWMRVPILYPENRPLAAEALREAADVLKSLGRTDQAETLLREAEELSGR